MIGEIVHVGVTVSDMDRSIAFYRDILGLEYKGELTMSGEATDRLFQREGVVARVAYLNGSDNISCPPVELICFDEGARASHANLFSTSISEICFVTDDIDREYMRLVDLGVECLSAPQDFDFSSAGFGKSRALYFRDPDGIILELMQYL